MIMKKTILILATLFASVSTFAQTDSVRVERNDDTIRIGGMIILKKGGSDNKKRVTVSVGNRRNQYKHSNVSTSSIILDIGFANWTDKTNYATATANNSVVNRPGTPNISGNDLKLRTGKSVNVNIWFVMQRVNLIKHYVNLKYGIGLELNNYRFSSNISFRDAGLNPYNNTQSIPHAFVFRDSVNFTKNKLAADYVTIPLMLNFRANPNASRGGFSISAGVSMGYLYNGRNKQISGERGKLKNHGDYDLQKWKFSYIGELGVGPIHLYGSYAPKSIFKNDLNFTPYNIGLRLSNW